MRGLDCPTEPAGTLNSHRALEPNAHRATLGRALYGEPPNSGTREPAPLVPISVICAGSPPARSSSKFYVAPRILTPKTGAESLPFPINDMLPLQLGTYARQ